MKVCGKCGAKMSDEYKFCEKCGAPLTGDGADTKDAASDTFCGKNYTYKDTSLSQLIHGIRHYATRIMRITALLMVILFFCPLFMVSCEAMQMKVSGFDTATGFSFDDDGNTKSNWLLTEEDNSHYYTQENASLPSGSLVAFGVLALAGAMLASTFTKTNSVSQKEQAKLRKIQAVLAIGHIAWLFYVLKGLEKSAKIEGMAWASTMLVTVEPTGWFKLDIAVSVLFAAVALICSIDEDPLKKTSPYGGKSADVHLTDSEMDALHDTSADEFFETEFSAVDLNDVPDGLPDDLEKESCRKEDSMREKEEKNTDIRLRINKSHATSETEVKTSSIKIDNKNSHFHKPSSL